MLHLRPLMIIAAVIAMLGFGARAHAQETIVRGGKPVLTCRTITVTPETQLAIVGPDYANFDGLPDGFVEGALPPGEIYLNDYVTIDCWHEGKRLVALKMTVLEVAAA